MTSKNQIKAGAVLSYIAIAVNILAGLIYTPWMIGRIGQSQYGLYTLANSLITLFMVDFGLSSATTRYLSRFNAAGDRRGAEEFLGAIYKLYLLFDAAILAVLTVLFFKLDSIYVNLSSEELEQFKVIYVMCALFSVINFPFVTFNGMLSAYEKFVPLKLADVFYRIANVGFTVAALLLGYGLYALVAVHVAVGLLTLLFKFIAVRKLVPLRVRFGRSDRGIYKEIFGFSVWVTVSTLAQRLVFNITPTILGIVANSAAIAVFGVVTTIEGYVYTITTAINGMFMPRISRIIVRGEDRKRLSDLLLSVGKFQFLLNGLIISGFAVLGKEFVQLWLGQDYLPAYSGILLVILPGLFFNSLQIANTTIIVENRVKIQALINLATGLVNVALSFVLSARWGVLGACISICAACTLRAAAMNVVSQRVLALDMRRFAKDCYLRLSLPTLLTVLAGIGIVRLLPGGGWGWLALKGVLVTAFFCLISFWTGFSKAERRNICAYITTHRR